MGFEPALPKFSVPKLRVELLLEGETLRKLPPARAEEEEEVVEGDEFSGIVGDDAWNERGVGVEVRGTAESHLLYSQPYMFPFLEPDT